MLGACTLTRRIHCALCFALSLLPLAAQPPRIGSIRRLDPAVDNVVPPNAAIEKVAGNLQFAEGPVWVRNRGYLLFSDIPANAIMKWIPSGQLTLFRKPVFPRDFTEGMQIGTNGLTLDREGRLIACEHGNRRVSRTEKDGTIVTLADHYQGRRFNSPNDVICKSNGDLYFTDSELGRSPYSSRPAWRFPAGSGFQRCLPHHSRRQARPAHARDDVSQRPRLLAG